MVITEISDLSTFHLMVIKKSFLKQRFDICLFQVSSWHLPISKYKVCSLLMSETTYYQTNRETILHTATEYYENNRERLREQARI